MDLRDLPWWEGGYNEPQYLPKDILLERIEQVPLTIDLVKSFLDNWVLSFHLWDVDFYAMCWEHPINYPYKKLSKFSIAVN